MPSEFTSLDSNWLHVLRSYGLCTCKLSPAVMLMEPISWLALCKQTPWMAGLCRCCNRSFRIMLPETAAADADYPNVLIYERLSLIPTYIDMLSDCFLSRLVIIFNYLVEETGE